MNSGILYYTDNRIDESISNECRKYISRSELPITSVSLSPISFGNNIVLNAKRSKMTMFKQILLGLESAPYDYVFLCEHDVLYPISHFEANRPPDDKYSYNSNLWNVRTKDGMTSFCNNCSSLSSFFCNKNLLLNHYKKRISKIEEEYSGRFPAKMGYEPGTIGRKESVDNIGKVSWKSPAPILDLAHGKNLTLKKFSIADFRNKNYANGFVSCNIKDNEHIKTGWDLNNLSKIIKI